MNKSLHRLHELNERVKHMERDVEQTMNNRFSPYDRDRDFRRIVFSFKKNTRNFGRFEAVSDGEFCDTDC